MKKDPENNPSELKITGKKLQVLKAAKITIRLPNKSQLFFKWKTMCIVCP